MIRKNINTRFQSNRTLALQTALNSIRKTLPNILESNESYHVASEWALLLQARGLFENNNSDGILIKVEEIIRLRISNLYQYQQKMDGMIAAIMGEIKRRTNR
jgi:hypothetical protein